MTGTDQIIERASEEAPAARTMGQFSKGYWSALRALAQAPVSATTGAVVAAFNGAVAGCYAPVPKDAIDREIERLRSMRGAQPGWAGLGSCAPSDASIDAAISLMQRLRCLPVPVPMASVGSHGNAGLYWSDDKFYADVELMEDGKVGYLVEVKGRGTVDNEEDLPEVGLPRMIAHALATAYLSNSK